MQQGRSLSSHSSNVQLAAFNVPASSRKAAVLFRRHAVDASRISSCVHGAPPPQQQHGQQHNSWQKLQMEHSTQPWCSTICKHDSQQDMHQQQLQTHVLLQQAATAQSTTDCSHEQQEQQHQVLVQRQPQSLLAQQQRRRRRQQRQQPIVVTDAAVRNALQACSSWAALANYLLQHAQLENHHQHHQQQQVPLQADRPQSSSSSASKQQQRQDKTRHKQLLWQQLNGYQARLVVRHAAQLASAQQRLSVQAAAGHMDAAQDLKGHVVPPSRLQWPLALLLQSAVLRAAASPGDAVMASDLLRCVWRLGALQQQQQRRQQNKKLQQQQGQQLLDMMCAGRFTADKSAVAGPAPTKRQQWAPVQNANLLADVAQSVIHLQLQPSDEWFAWFGETSLAILQQQQQQERQARHVSPGSYFLISSLCLTCYAHNMQAQQQQQQQQPQQQQQQQQQQHRTFPDNSWFQSWAAAAAQSHPFSTSQLLLVVSAAQQLQLQLPSSFWQAHLSAAGVRKLPAQQLLQLLVQLPPLLQHRQHDGDRQQHQRQVLLPADWRAAAADLMVLHVSSATSTSTSTRTATAASMLRLLPQVVTAACQLQLPLQQGGVQQLLQSLLQETSPAGAMLASSSSSSSNSNSSSNTAINAADSSSHSSSILSQSSAKAAASAVAALAQMSIAQPPPAHLLTQLQLQLMSQLRHCNMQALIDLLWVFAVKWRVQPTKPWLSGLLAATEPLLGCSSPQQLRMLIVGLSLLHVAVPQGWMQAYLQATAAVMGNMKADISSSSSSSSSSGDSKCSNSNSSVGSRKPPQQQQQQQQRILAAESTGQPFAAFLGNVAYSLVQLKATPSPGWQLAWQRAVAHEAQHMSPNQLIDALYAAAVWADSEQGWAAAAAVDTTAAAVNSELHLQPAMAAAAALGTSGSVQVSTPAAFAAAGAGARQYSSTVPQLLPKPQRRWHESTGNRNFAPFQAADSIDSAGQAHWRSMQQRQPRVVWVRGLLQHLRQLLPRCTPTHLTTALWCLRPLLCKASVAWLDAVYDALLGQLHQCSMLQLQQLLRSLLHQDHILAPARIDAVLDAALVVLLKGKQHCSEQQLVWLLQLVVLLHHEPEPEFTKQVAAAAERMLCSHSCSESNQHVISSSLHSSSAVAALVTGVSYSNRGGGWSPGLLTDLLDAFSQLGGQEFPASWGKSYRKAARCCLPHFTGLQLARVLSAAALLHWELPRPFVQQLLRQLQRHMDKMDVHALGLVGVAVGQMGLLVGREWAQQYMARVQHLARDRSVRIPVSDVGNLQRSVQYLRWCGGRTRVLHRSSLLYRVNDRSRPVKADRRGFGIRPKRCKGHVQLPLRP